MFDPYSPVRWAMICSPTMAIAIRCRCSATSIHPWRGAADPRSHRLTYWDAESHLDVNNDVICRRTTPCWSSTGSTVRHHGRAVADGAVRCTCTLLGCHRNQFVSPIDALVVINTLNHQGEHEEEGQGGAANWPRRRSWLWRHGPRR